MKKSISLVAAFLGLASSSLADATRLPKGESLLIYDHGAGKLKLIKPASASKQEIGAALVGASGATASVTDLGRRLTVPDGARVRLYVANVNFATFNVEVKSEQKQAVAEVPDLFAKYLSKETKALGAVGQNVQVASYEGALNAFDAAVLAYVEEVKPFQKKIALAASRDTYTALKEELKGTKKPNPEQVQKLREAVGGHFEALRTEYYKLNGKKAPVIVVRSFETAETDYIDLKELDAKVSEALTIYEKASSNQLFAESFIQQEATSIDFDGGTVELTVKISRKDGKGSPQTEKFVLKEQSRKWTHDFSTGFVFSEARDYTYGVATPPGGTPTIVRKGRENQVIGTAQFLHGLYNFDDNASAGLSIGLGLRDTKDLFFALGGSVGLKFNGFGRNVVTYFTWGTALFPLERVSGFDVGDSFSGDTVPTSRQTVRTTFFGFSARF